MAATAAAFAVMANQTVACTNGTIEGRVGTFVSAPAGSVTQTACPITGNIHVGGGLARLSYNYFLDAHDVLAPMQGQTCTVLTGSLAGVTLPPGAYCFPSAATLTGLLTLDGPNTGIWMFRIGTAGTGALTADNFQVVMAGGARPCNATWWIRDGATLTTSNFQGNLLAGAPLTLTGGTFEGHAWSKGNLTITGTAIETCRQTVKQVGMTSCRATPRTASGSARVGPSASRSSGSASASTLA